MDEIAFTLFCGVIIALTLSIGISLHALKTLDTCKEFMDFVWHMLEEKNYTHKPEITD